MSALGSLLATGAPRKPDDPPPLPSHARKAVTNLLGQQLLREHGVEGLCTAILGDDVEQHEAIVVREEDSDATQTGTPPT